MGCEQNEKLGLNDGGFTGTISIFLSMHVELIIGRKTRKDSISDFRRFQQYTRNLLLGCLFDILFILDLFLNYNHMATLTFSTINLVTSVEVYFKRVFDYFVLNGNPK